MLQKVPIRPPEHGTAILRNSSSTLRQQKINFHVGLGTSIHSKKEQNFSLHLQRKAKHSDTEVLTFQWRLDSNLDFM